MEVKKVLVRSDGVKYLIIPKHSKLNTGDFVKLVKLKATKEEKEIEMVAEQELEEEFEEEEKEIEEDDGDEIEEPNSDDKDETYSRTEKEGEYNGESKWKRRQRSI